MNKMIYTKNNITKRLQATAPQPKNNEAFMADTIRQINLLPSPESELQRSLHRYTWMERLCMRVDAVRWMLLGGTSTIVVGYMAYIYYDVILSGVMTLLSML